MHGFTLFISIDWIQISMTVKIFLHAFSNPSRPCMQFLCSYYNKLIEYVAMCSYVHNIALLLIIKYYMYGMRILIIITQRYHDSCINGNYNSCIFKW